MKLDPALAALQRHVLSLKARRLGALGFGSGRGPLSTLFPKQREVVDHPSKRKVLICGRRAGKTDVIIKDLANGMLEEPNSANLYCALTIGSALNIFWKPFRRLNDQHGWGFVFNEAKHQISHPNGSWLAIGGGDKLRDLEKYRGTPWRRVRVDESGAWRPSLLQYFVREILEPAFMDFDGDVWLAGTPGRQCFGYFYESCLGKNGFEVFRWTAADNPHVRWQSFIHHPKTGVLAVNGWTEDNPIFKREYLALWSVDPSELVYAFDRTRNVVNALPECRFGYGTIVGFDFGVNNACAYSVIKYPLRVGNWMCTVETYKAHGLAPSQFAPIANEVLNRVRPDKAVGDSGGLGKAFLQEYSIRYSDWVIVPADKRERRGTIELVSDMLRTGRKLVLEGNDDLINEWSTLQWDEDREDVAEGLDDDVSDADMYGSKECPSFLHQAADEPEPESAWERVQRERQRQREMDEAEGHYLEVGD